MSHYEEETARALKELSNEEEENVKFCLSFFLLFFFGLFLRKKKLNKLSRCSLCLGFVQPSMHSGVKMHIFNVLDMCGFVYFVTE